MNSTNEACSPSSNVTALFGPIMNVESVKSAWFAILIIGGQILLPLILLTMLLSKNVRRGPALINFIVVTIEFSIFATLLLYAGASRGPEPSFALCLAQASVLYGSFPAISLACLIVVFQIWRSLRAVTNGTELEEERCTRIQTVLFVLAPHALWLIFLVASIVIGSRSPQSVTRCRSLFYCSIGKGNIDIAATLVTTLNSLGVIIFEVWTLFLLYTKWSSTLTDINLPHTKLAFNVRLIKRMMIYSMVILLVFLSDIFQEHHPMLRLIYFFSVASIPLAIALVFGTQPSILRVWCFWKPRKPRTEEDSYARTFSIVSRTETLVHIDTKLQLTKSYA